MLPVLPIALSAGVTGGRRRPLGIVVGLVGSFTFATVALVYVIDALGLPNGLLRTVAIVVLAVFGIALLAPAAAARVEALLSRLGPKTGTRLKGDGFWSGALAGTSLGLVYAPCAGPVLAGVITVSASQPFTAGRLAVAFAYALGSALTLYVLMLGGRRLVAPLARHSGSIQLGTGVVMVAVAIAMIADYDLRFQSAIANDLPSFLVTPTGSLERSASARRALDDLQGGSKGVGGAANKAIFSTADGSTPDLPVIGQAPDFTGTQKWFNTPGGKALTLRQLRGKVVLIDFWTYSCINCIRTTPYLNGWEKRYASKGLTIVGIHAPEFPFEKSAGNVAAAIKREHIRYPVVQDNDLRTWDAYGNQGWPSEYYVDARGRVRFQLYGEGAYAEKEQVIRALLEEAGHNLSRTPPVDTSVTPAAPVITAESYLGAARADRFENGLISPGTQSFGAAPKPAPDHLAYGGRWQIGEEAAVAAGGDLRLHFHARHVFLVLGSPARKRSVRVELDGRPITAKAAGADVHDGRVVVDSERLYELVDLPAIGDHQLRLRPDAGVAAYAFTFG